MRESRQNEIERDRERFRNEKKHDRVDGVR